MSGTRRAPAATVAALPVPPARYVACPGNVQPWGSAHAFPVWLAVIPCKGGKVKSIHLTCKVCGWKGFFYGEWWLRGGVDRAWLAAYSPHAVDGYGLPINPRNA